MDLARLFLRFPVLETENLILRQLIHEDAAAVLEVFSDPDVTRHYDLETMTDIEEAEIFIDSVLHAYRTRAGVRWAITRKGESRVIGSCGYPIFVQRADQGEIGYELGRPYWRKGVMSEALRGVLRFGFEEVGLNRVQALVQPDNGGSAKLLESLGFKTDGLLRQSVYYKGRYRDHLCLSLLKEEWDAISPSSPADVE